MYSNLTPKVMLQLRRSKHLIPKEDVSRRFGGKRNREKRISNIFTLTSREQLNCLRAIGLPLKMVDKIYWERFCGDNVFWDYETAWNTTLPRLTRCFHQTVLTWIPTFFLWTFAIFEVYRTARPRNKPIPWSYFNATRFNLSLLIIFINVTHFFIIFHREFQSSFQPPVTSDFAAPLLRSASYTLIALFLYFHRKRGIHTSALIWSYLFFETLCLFPVFYQLWIDRTSYSALETVLYFIYFPILVGLLVLSSFADGPVFSLQPDESDKHPTEKRISPEVTASFLSQIIYWWFNEMAILGWKQSLTSQDLWELREDLKTRSCIPKFEAHLKNSLRSKRSELDSSVTFNGSTNAQVHVETNPQKHDIKQRINIVPILSKTHASYFLVGSFCKLVHDILQFVTPKLLKSLIQFVENEFNEPIWHGILIAIGMFLVSSMQSLVLNFYFYRMYITGMRITSGLTAAIYKKSLNLGDKARKETTTGEIVNLMAVDSKRFLDIIPFLNLVWSAPLQIFLASYFLYEELGFSALFGLAVMVLMIPLNGLIAFFSRRLQVKLMKQKDERVKFLNEILNGIKILKFYAWEESFMNHTTKLRERELNHLRWISYLGSVVSFLWTCAPMIVSVTTFAVYVTLQGETLTAQKAFVALSLFNILRFPLTMLPQLITYFVTISVSIKRLNKFLSREDLDPYISRDDDKDAIVIEDGYFRWGAKEEKETKKETKGREENVAKAGEENGGKKPEATNTTDRTATNSNRQPSEVVYDQPNLSNINIRVPKGDFVAVVGSVGSGKSSLISAVLGQMEHIKGRVNISGDLKIAYVSQQAWIQNSTLKENVLFGLPYDENRYNRTVEVCALKPDIAFLPGGDETEIGEKGINLSGGQKQRVSLARACYSNADLYIMDDPLSAVDAHVAKHLFDNVLSSKTGILKNKTRFLVTNRLDILSKVDNIIVLKKGSISEMGTYKQLMDAGKDFSDLVKQFSTVSDNQQEESDHGKSSSVEADDLEKTFASVNEEKNKKLIEAEKAETGQVKWKVYAEYFKMVSLPWMLLIIIGYSTSSGFSLGSNIWLSKWSSSAKISNTTLSDTYRFLTVYSIIGALQGFSVIFGSLVLVVGTLRASVASHQNLLYKVLRSPMSFFDTTPIGRIVNRFAKDIDTVDSVIPHNIRSWLICLLNVVTTFMIITLQTPLFLSILIPVGVIYYIIQQMYVATSRQLKRLESISRSPIYSHFGETLTGVNVIRAYDVSDRFIAESASKVDHNQSCYYPNIIANRWIGIRLEFCGNIIILAAATFAVLARKSLSGGDVGLSISYALSVTSTLNWLVRMSSEIETNIVAVERILEYCYLPSEADWKIGKLQPSDSWPENGQIVFDKYEARYRSGLDLVLRNMNALIHPREKVGIVGRTGAGKSTITLSLFRLIEPASGKIIIDDYDISHLALHTLRSKLTIIPQDPVLFSGTLRFNLDPFDQYSDQEIWDALAHAHMKEFVASLEKGLLHTIAEEGKNLSVGQRQLMCLARALLKKPKILFLDEATAAIDLETDSLIQTTIREEFKTCTIMTIAHRLNTIMDSDRVMVLDQGVIAEFDSPKNLLQNSRGIFYSLAKEANLIT